MKGALFNYLSCVFFCSHVSCGGGLVLWTNVRSSCLFICTSFVLFHDILVSLSAAVVVQRKSQRIWNRAHQRISHKLCWENSNVSPGSVRLAPVYQVIGCLTRCNTDYLTYSVSDNNTVIKKGVVSPSLTPPFHRKRDVFLFFAVTTWWCQ